MYLAAMDALSSSLFISRIPDGNMNNMVVQLPQFAVKPGNKRAGTLKINQSFNLSLWVSSSKRIGASGSRVLAVSKDVSGEGTENPGSDNGHISVFEDIVSVGEATSSPKQNSTTTFGDASKVVTPLTAGSGSGTGGGTRAGLFRTPISGGVQSATSAHGLPRPALAVRNLMEQARDVYFIGGFGTVAWVDVKEYEDLKPDKIALEGGEQYLKELNAIFSIPLKELLSTEIEVDDAALISIDSKGTDVRVRQGAQFNVQRISFEQGQAVETLEEAKAALQRLINKGRLNNLQK